MRTNVKLTAYATCWAIACWAAGAGATGDAVAAAGLIQFDPPQAKGCVAVRVAVPEDKMLTGLRWYNGTSAVAFPRVLVASGRELAPPPYSDAVVMAEVVVGQQEAWSEITFAAPIASESEALFVVIEYPANYTPPAQGTALGVGYAQDDASYPYFVSGDGETWIRIASGCRVLLEPVLADRVRDARALKGIALNGSAEKLGLFAMPNPFNPQTKIELSLAAAASGDLRVYDVRGRLVVELHRGALAEGVNTFTWNGRDSGGRPVASGPYWVQARTPDQSLTKKVLLLK